MADFCMVGRSLYIYISSSEEGGADGKRSNQEITEILALRRRRRNWW